MKPTPNDIDEAVAKWHISDSHLSLFEWLGWSWQEYIAWVDDYHNVPDRPLLKHEGDDE